MSSSGMSFDIHKISPDQLGRLGVSQIAYVKPMLLNGAQVFAIHAADGSQLAVAENRDLAVATIVQNEMLATLVH
jgi:hypothetical protein